MRILFVNSHLIGEKSATGDTLKNIFGNMGNIDILQYTFFPGIREKVAFEGTPVETISNKKTNFVNEFIYRHHKKNIEGNQRTSQSQSNSWKSKLKLKLKKDALMWNELIPIRIDRACMQKIVDFAPELIYTLGADINVLQNAIKMSNLFNIPIVLHNMDDLYHTKFDGHTFFQKFAKRKLQKLSNVCQ